MKNSSGDSLYVGSGSYLYGKLSKGLLKKEFSDQS
ncbi:MAG: hypothetical protein PWR06_2766 [Thermoanaerobacteraceae bacterium]|nr:hypothetical protein [Thermoanaerobacteraceae bacterium]